MIARHPYQNPINKRYVCKNNYSLTHVFQLLVYQLFFVDMSHIYQILISLTWCHLIQNIFSQKIIILNRQLYVKITILNLNTQFNTTSKNNFILNFLTQWAAHILHMQPLLVYIKRANPHNYGVFGLFNSHYSLASLFFFWQ